MKIFSENKQRFIEVATASAELANFPSMSFTIEVSTPEVSGHHPEVWFVLDTIEQFLRELAELDQKREGECMLESMSPGVCELTIRGLDRRGHLAVRIKLSNDIYNMGPPFKYGLFSEFEVDPTCLPSVIQDFKELIAEQKRLSA